MIEVIKLCFKACNISFRILPTLLNLGNLTMACSHSEEMSSVTVSELQQLNFSQLSLHEKITFKKRGRPTPDIKISQPGTSNNKKYIN